MKDVTDRKQNDREHEALFAVSLALRAANDSEAMLSVILQEITATFGAIKSFFIAPDPLTDEMVVRAVFEDGDFSLIRGVRIPPGVGVAAKVYENGEPYVADNAFDDPLFATPELLGEAGAVACVPLIAQEKTIGLFSVARRLPMSSNDVRLLVAIADMAATGLQRAAYHEETLRYAANLEREVAEQTRELREANLRLQELDKLKSKFVSDVSHELRTPVTNMGLYLKLFNRKPEKQGQYLDILQEEAERLETLVLDILDLAQLDNQPTVAQEPINLNELLQAVLTAHQAKADERQLVLSMRPAQRLPMCVGDTHKLIQVATNLVANAINYTPKGYVRISTFVSAPQSVSFAVEDSGVGIYPEDMPHIFERFYRGRRDQVADIPGTGLGLSIVKELVELHNGSIQIESEVGRGTTFTITLPETPHMGK
jgi:signal transduction histidine kinase